MNYDYKERAKTIENEIIADRRYLHENPELGMVMPKTVEYITNRLKQMGYNPKAVGGGISALVGKSSQNVILLRADMDALPITEKSGVAFSSKNDGVAHCCGHDNHSAMLLGAAKMLKENEANLTGTVKLMFQPGEETLQGARAMIAAGVLEEPKVTAAFAVHVNSILKCGRILVASGPVTSSSDKFEILINGHGSHASRPHESIDPINVASFIHSALMELNAREIPQQEFVVLSIGAISAGEAANAIPSTAIMKGSLRTYSPQIREMVMERVTVISEKIAEAFRATAIVTFLPNCTTSLVADNTMSDIAIGAARTVVGYEEVTKMTQKNSASEDFALIGQNAPSTMAILGAAISDDVKYGQHNPNVIFNEECLHIGAALYAQTADNWLNAQKSQEE